MSAEVKPALSPAEWGIALHLRELFGPTTLTHGQAALALYGQPFGFDAADLSVLRLVASGGEVVLPEDWRRLDSIGDRIAALLPPEPAP